MWELRLVSLDWKQNPAVEEERFQSLWGSCNVGSMNNISSRYTIFKIFIWHNTATGILINLIEFLGSSVETKTEARELI